MAGTDFVEGDTGSRIRVTIKRKSDGTVLDLTGASVTLIWKDASDVEVEKAMTIENPATSGIVSYQFEGGELYPHTMEFEVRVTDSAGFILRNLDELKFTIRPKLDT